MFDELQKAATAHSSDPRHSLLSCILASDSPLTEEEILVQCASILVDGAEPLANAIANGALLALRDPDLWQRMVTTGAMSAAEAREMLRLESPFQYVARYARVPLEIGGCPIKRGMRVMFMLGAANRDGQHFPKPERFDPNRADGRHLAFGHGIHTCLGAAFARRAVEKILPRLARCFPDLNLAKGGIRWRKVLASREMDNFSVNTTKK